MCTMGCWQAPKSGALSCGAARAASPSNSPWGSLALAHSHVSNVSRARQWSCAEIDLDCRRPHVLTGIIQRKESLAVVGEGRSHNGAKKYG